MPSTVQFRARVLRTCVIVSAACVALAMYAAPGPAATSVVGATVLSATNLSVAGCPSGELGRTHFGSVQPGSSNVTTLDCTVSFGSSNDTARLRLRQADGSGVGMWNSSGQLDTTFSSGDGTDGTNTFDLQAGTEEVKAAFRLPDGKLLLVGQSTNTFLMKLNSDGTLDTTWSAGDGTDGLSYLTTVGTNVDAERLPDGKLVLVGSAGFDYIVSRINSDGTLDTTYSSGDGSNGTTTVDFGPEWTNPKALVLQPDGSAVIAGDINQAAGLGGVNFAATRLTASGAIDATFSSGDGSNGYFTYDVAGMRSDYDARPVLMPDGSIVLAGNATTAANGTDFVAVRLTSAGAMDMSFSAGDGTDGRAFMKFDYVHAWADALVYDAVALDDGRIVLVGEVQGAGDNDVAVARLTASGAIDTTFSGGDGTDGTAVYGSAVQYTYDWASNVHVLPDGKLLLVGQGERAPPWTMNMGAIRLNADGTKDVTFATNEVDHRSSIDISATGNDSADVSVVLPDGKVFMAGQRGAVLAIAQLDSVPVDQYDDAGGDDWSTPDAGFFGMCLRSVSNAAATWSTSATCPATDGPEWREVPTTLDDVATTAALVTTGSASFRFGLRAAPGLLAGSYIAPITFDVIAPSA